MHWFDKFIVKNKNYKQLHKSFFKCSYCVIVHFIGVNVLILYSWIWQVCKKEKLRQSLIKQGLDIVTGTNLNRQVHSMQMLHLPWVSKAFAISVKTGFSSFGKVDLPFHAPVSQKSVNTWRHSSTGLKFYDRQENDFRAKKSSFPYLLFLLCPPNFDFNCLYAISST